MSAAISPFLNLPVGHSEIKRRHSDEQPEMQRKRQKLDPPASSSSQVDDWVNRNIEDIPKILDSNSPIKKRWTDTVDQAKAIDSIKRALVQITTSYKKENIDPSPGEARTIQSLTPTSPDTSTSHILKTRGVLTTQQPRYEPNHIEHPTTSSEVIKDVFYNQQNCENTNQPQYNTCYNTYQSVPNHNGVFKHEKQVGQFHYQPYPSPPRTDTDMMYSNLSYTQPPHPNSWPVRHYQSPQPHISAWSHPEAAPSVEVTECLSPSEQTYLSTPNSPDVPLTPPDDQPDMKPKIFTNLSDYNLQIDIGKSSMSPAEPSTSQQLSLVGDLQNFHPMDVFCTVPGRLSLLSGASKYNVTIGEVQRRLTYPESLNVSLLGGVLRRAKAKNGNHALRSQLIERGITIPTGRRKAASVSLFTSLLEGESAQLANDFNTLCEKFFPCRELAKAAVINDSHRYHLSQDDHVRRVMNTKQMVADLQELMEMNVVKNNEIMNTQGVNGHNMVPCPQLMTFELLTHGFGASALSAALNVVQTYLDEMMKCMTQ